MKFSTLFLKSNFLNYHTIYKLKLKNINKEKVNSLTYVDSKNQTQSKVTI